jgi:fructose-bisphosphate aldolase class II
MINKYGGKIPETYGVPIEEIQKGIKSGVRKVNIDTDNRLAITAAIREAAAKDPSNFDPRHFMKPSIKYMKQVCLERYDAFGSAGNASKIKQVSLDDFAAKYAKGELAASVKKAAAV